MGSIVESRLKELHPVMPVMFIKAVTQDKQELRDVAKCCYDNVTCRSLALAALNILALDRKLLP